jgi:hypothetical protein
LEWRRLRVAFLSIEGAEDIRSFAAAFLEILKSHFPE